MNRRASSASARCESVKMECILRQLMYANGRFLLHARRVLHFAAAPLLFLSVRVVLVAILALWDITIGVAGTVVNLIGDVSARHAEVDIVAKIENSDEARSQCANPTDMQCGRHSLFILVRLLGRDIPYAEIERNTPVGLNGSSLLELQEAARKLGIDLSIYKAEPTHVDAVRNSRSIVLIRAKYRKEGDKKIMLEGHYVVTEPVSGSENAGHINIIDSAFNCRESLSDEDFTSVWTGYYLTSSPWYVSAWPQRTAVAGAICLLGLVAWRFRCHHAGHAAGCAMASVERHLTEA
jgi:hypothetical protein